MSGNKKSIIKAVIIALFVMTPFLFSSSADATSCNVNNGTVSSADSDAVSNRALNAQCQMMESEGGIDSTGIMWVNAVHSGPGIFKDIVDVDANQKTATIYFHGAFWSGWGNPDSSTLHIGVDVEILNEDDRRVDYIYDYGTSIVRGRHNGFSNNISQLSVEWENGPLEATLDIDSFKNQATRRLEGSYYIWEKDVYVYRCWDWSGNRCGTNVSTIRVRSEAFAYKEHYGSYSSTTTATVGAPNNQNAYSTSPGVHYVQSPNNNNTSTQFSFRHTLFSSFNDSLATGSTITNTTPSYSAHRYDGAIDSGRSTIALNGNSNIKTYFGTTNINLGTIDRRCQQTDHTNSFKITERTYADGTAAPGDGYPKIEYIGWKDNSSSACAEARHPYDFTTAASIDSLPSTINIGESITPQGSVKNSSTHDNNNATPHTITPSDTEFRLFWFTTNSASVANLNGTNNYGGDPCAYFQTKASIACKGNLATGGGSVNPGEAKSLKGQSINISDSVSAIGQKICAATAINYTDSGSGYNGGLNKRWTISNASCTTVTKKPNFQAWGGVYSPSNITTSQTKKGGTTYGSWAEHLAVAKGSIRGFASGATLGYNGYGFLLPTGNTNGSMSTLSPLTIANTNASNLGHSNINASNQIVNSLKQRFTNSVNDQKIGIEYKTASNIGLTTRSRGTLVYNAGNGDITISGNICYSSSATTCSNSSPTILNTYGDVVLDNLNDMPQILIFARNINIAENVSRIDAWLISDGTINTCAGKNSVSSLNSGICNKTLMINGPVFAKNLKLMRTAGANAGSGTQQSSDVLSQDISDDGSGAPAEVFNLRGDAYLWSYLQAQRTNEAVTTYIRELAPRL